MKLRSIAQRIAYFKCAGLLPFYPVRVYRIYQSYRMFCGDLPDQFQSIIEIAFYRDNFRAMDHRL